MQSALEGALPVIAKLSERVIRIMGLNPGIFTLEGSNTYLVGTGTDRVLIDSGEGVAGYLDLLRCTIDAESARIGHPIRVSTLLLTHWHQDHVGGATDVLSLFPHATCLKQPSRYSSTSVDGLCRPPPPRIEVEGATLELIHTPGHTDDHLCAVLAEENAIFTSDLVLGTGTSVFACYTDFMSSLELLKTYKPQHLYPAHGPVVENGVAKLQEIVNHRATREKQILQALSDDASRVRDATADTSGEVAALPGLCIRQLVQQIYTATPSALKDAAGLNVFHHLKKLVRQKTVVAVVVPGELTNVLSDASDYAMLGEGAKTDLSFMQRVFTELRFAHSSLFRPSM